MLFASSKLAFCKLHNYAPTSFSRWHTVRSAKWLISSSALFVHLLTTILFPSITLLTQSLLSCIPFASTRRLLVNNSQFASYVINARLQSHVGIRCTKLFISSSKIILHILTTIYFSPSLFSTRHYCQTWLGNSGRRHG